MDASTTFALLEQAGANDVPADAGVGSSVFGRLHPGSRQERCEGLSTQRWIEREGLGRPSEIL
jgi:hypothetical protein